MLVNSQANTEDNELEPPLKESIGQFIQHLKMVPVTAALSDSAISGIAKLFLRARKYDCKRAIELFEAHQRMRSSWKLDEFNPLENDIRQELLSEKFTVICTNSCTIALFNAKRHWPPLCSNANLLKGLLYQLDCAMSNDVAQKNGITLIYNMNDSNYYNFDYPLSQKLLDIFTGCYPARLVKVLIVGPPFWFRINLWFLRIFLREKMRDRLFTLEQNELKDYLPVEQIPQCLGGSLQHNHLDWIRTCLSRSDHLSVLPTDYFDSISSSLKRSQFQFPQDITAEKPINKSTASPVSSSRASPHNSVPLFVRRVDSSVKYQSVRRANSSLGMKFLWLQNSCYQSPLEFKGRSLTIDTRRSVDSTDDSSPDATTTTHSSRKRPNFSPPPSRSGGGGAFSSDQDYQEYKAHASHDRNGAKKNSVAYSSPRIFIVKCVPTDSLGDGFAAIDPNSKTMQSKTDFIKSLSHSDSHRRLRALFERKFTPSSMLSEWGTLSYTRFKANTRFNRYKDVVCIDQSAVQLSNDQYIHANWVHGYKNFNSYILTQGPLEETTAHFWQLVWETCSPTIVMLTKVFENGSQKCHQYWPSDAAHSRRPYSEQMRRDTLGQLIMQAPPFEIRLLDEQFVDKGRYAMCDLEISNRSEPEVAPLRCKHYLYLGWPDFDVPKEASDFLHFLRAVNSNHQEVSGRMKLQTSASVSPPFLKQPPKIVHCSAGIGRTGTYVAIDVNCALVKDCGQVDVVGSLQRLRRQRAATVQVDKQFAFVHEALRHFIDQNSVDFDPTPK